jgi:hypothetical protein
LGFEIWAFTVGVWALAVELWSFSFEIWSLEVGILEVGTWDLGFGI